MSTQNEHTTMICLFHTPDQADAAVKDLVRAGFAKEAIGVMGNSGSAAANPVAMEKWKVPERDAKLLTEGMNKGGIVVAVSAGTQLAEKVEEIFGRHEASQIDETTAGTVAPTKKMPVVNAVGTPGKIDVVEEEMKVGKRQVQRGGVRVYQRVIEKPVSETVTLREEHVSVERHPVSRPISGTDATAFKDQSIEITERGEEAVVSKTARVVEEVLIGKQATEHVETVKGKVRKTDVTVESIDPESIKVAPGKTKSRS